MSFKHPLNSRISNLRIICFILISYFPGFILSAVVSLSSIEIFKTHDWLKVTPTVYFLCKGDKKTVLPDVKKPNVLFTFNGQESWQPLTDFSTIKCKRCGFYEEESIVSDIEFDEWEFCPSDFAKSDGEYIRFKEKELNATFLCRECSPPVNVSSSAPGKHGRGKGMHVAVVILLSVVLSTILILGVVSGYKYWQKKKRERDQARFLKLFEDGDDIEDELGLDVI